MIKKYVKIGQTGYAKLSFYYPHNSAITSQGIIFPLEVAVAKHFYMQHGSELPWYFYMLMENPLRYPFQVWSPVLFGGFVQPDRTLIFVSPR